MKKITLSLMLCCLTMGQIHAQQQLQGFLYGKEIQPAGTEWESPQKLSLNKEQPHADFFPFADKQSALKVLPEYSKYWESLDGTWKFHWAPNPAERPKDFYLPHYDAKGWDDITVPSCWNVVGIQKDGSLKYGVPVYVNQKVIFQHSVKVGDWKGGVMRTPPKDWTTYKYRNEVGSYRRTFTVPDDWKGREVYINFDGVNSFFYLWINGHYVGFSKNSRNTASFNISDYLVKGKNVVAVEVYRNSDGSFLEAQDMFRLPGIFRSTYLYATARTQIRDMKVITERLGENSATIDVQTMMRNLNKKAVKGYTLSYTIFANKLYSDEILRQVGEPITTQAFGMTKDGTDTLDTKITIAQPQLWSAERPYRYTLLTELKDKKGKVVEMTSMFFGVRQVEIRDTEAKDDEFGMKGRYFYVNNKPVKLKGVNRQEINPATGNAITHKQMEDEIMLMKRGNINHVRNSHYSNNPYWYYLCDKYGIYLEDEANLESHEYYYGDASLSHVPEFKNAHVARVMELVHAHVNHPSIVIWSLGNEAGPGKNFVAAYQAIKKFDKTRPVQYERNNDIVDMGSNQYPAVASVQAMAKGKVNAKYPFHISEYAHSMGNAGGNLSDYWKAIESSNLICGAAIWDWVDQALYNYDKKTGKRYFAYGGDFGDKPNDGTFCMNGILTPDHKPKPEFAEVKKVYQNVGVTMLDPKTGAIEVFNKNYFIPLTDYHMVWSLWKDGKKVEQSDVFVGPKMILGPRDSMTYRIPYHYDTLDPHAEYFVKVQFLLAHDMPWAKKGFVQMEEQLPVKAAEKFPGIARVAQGPAPTLVESEARATVEGKNFVAVFNNETGTLDQLTYNGVNIFVPGHGPQLDALRAPVDNDNWIWHKWFINGLHLLKHHVLAKTVYQQLNGNIILAYTVESQAPYGEQFREKGIKTARFDITKTAPFGKDDFKFVTNQVWTVYPDGSVELESTINSNKPSLILPRLGYLMKLPKDLNEYTYYGRGPGNNYSDRKTGYFIEEHKSTVDKQFVPFPKPQSMGNREDVRWCALTNQQGQGAEFISTSTFSTSALPHSALDMTLAPHPYNLPKSDANYLHLDMKVLGLGGNSCGQGGPLSPDIIRAGMHQMGFIIRPATANLSENAKVSASGVAPLAISRSKSGEVTINDQLNQGDIYYTINNSKKAQRYTAPFSLINGGKVTAWVKSAPKIKNIEEFAQIKTIPVQVVYASSQETDGGSASLLTDNNPKTNWQTMHSVTVAQYPHWVDFDCGTVKTIKGFTFLPCQNCNNKGNIKNFTISVSNDGKDWGSPVFKGVFDASNNLKTVLFAHPVRARYIRFTALSSQDGDDLATGAEFKVIVD